MNIPKVKTPDKILGMIINEYKDSHGYITEMLKKENYGFIDEVEFKAYVDRAHRLITSLLHNLGDGIKLEIVDDEEEEDDEETLEKTETLGDVPSKSWEEVKKVSLEYFNKHKGKRSLNSIKGSLAIMNPYYKKDIIKLINSIQDKEETIKQEVEEMPLEESEEESENLWD